MAIHHIREGMPEIGIEQTDPILYATLVEDCEKFWDDRPEMEKKYDRQGDKEEFIAREAAFVDKVSASVIDVAAVHDGPLTLLLDCDETFLKNEYDKAGRQVEKMHVRPGLAALLQKLDQTVGDKYDVGLLTSRAQSHLDEEFQTNQYGYMLCIGDRLNKDFIISSRRGSPILEQGELPLAPEHITYGDLQLTVDAIKSIIRPEIVEPILTDDHEGVHNHVYRGHWYDRKLAIVAHLADTNPDRGFVFVDDLPFPAAIDPDHPRVRGVALNEAMFSY